MDSVTKKGRADRSKINMHEDYEVKYWTKETRCIEGRAATSCR
ncbi:DUF3606 domain-containing protein [Bradyrhizobium manausense]